MELYIITTKKTPNIKIFQILKSLINFYLSFLFSLLYQKISY